MPTWPEADERKLLLCVIANAAAAPDWKAVAESMNGYSDRACQQKFYKLKRESETLVAGGTTSTAASSTPGSAKSTKANGTKSTSGGKRGRKAMATNGDAGADDDNDIDSPSKNKKRKTAVKKENVDSLKQEDGANGDDNATTNGKDNSASPTASSANGPGDDETVDATDKEDGGAGYAHA